VLLTKTPRSIFQFPAVVDATLAAALAVWPSIRKRSKNSVVGAPCPIAKDAASTAERGDRTHRAQL